MIDLYERIKEQSDKHNISSKELALLLDLKKSPLTDWKNQKSKPTLEQVIKMCEIFAVSSDYLLFGKSVTLSTEENKILECFHKMTPCDQEDFLMVAEMKAHKRKRRPTTSSHLENGNQTSETA